MLYFRTKLSTLSRAMLFVFVLLFGVFADDNRMILDGPEYPNIGDTITVTLSQADLTDSTIGYQVFLEYNPNNLVYIDFQYNHNLYTYCLISEYTTQLDQTISLGYAYCNMPWSPQVKEDGWLLKLRFRVLDDEVYVNFTDTDNLPPSVWATTTPPHSLEPLFEPYHAY